MSLDTRNHEKGPEMAQLVGLTLMRAISRHGDRTRLGAAVATASPLCSLIGTLQWYQELSAFGRDRAIAKLAGEHARETQRFRRPPQDGAKGGCDANYVRALSWIGHTQSQHWHLGKMLCLCRDRSVTKFTDGIPIARVRQGQALQVVKRTLTYSRDRNLLPVMGA